MQTERTSTESASCCSPPTTNCCAPAPAPGVTEARPDDLDQIEGLLSAAALPLEGVRDHLDDFMVVRNGDSLTGAICMEDYGQDVLLRSAVVSEAARQQGVGSILVKAFIERARSRGKQRIYLLTDTAPVFFERFGFQYIETDDTPEVVRASKEFSLCRAIGAQAMMLDLDKPLMDEEQLKAQVRQKYAGVAHSVAKTSGSSCCGTAPQSRKTQVTRDLYEGAKATCVPGASLEASRGCGDPTGEVEIRPGEVVLDLGSGGGVDVFLAAQQVGPAGKVYGLDMTDEMLELARRQAAENGFENVEFIRGEIESIPLPDQSVDVVISNCVISLVANKETAFREIFRVLKPDGRVSISDIVSTETLIPELKKDLDLWLGCLGGALPIDDYRSMMRRTGFDSVNIDRKRVYDLKGLLDDKKAEANARDDSHAVSLAAWNGELLSASVTAVRPAAA